MSPDFQIGHGYDNDEAGQANLAICADQISHRFGCVAVTLEQPFKDVRGREQPNHGFSPERSLELGSKMVEALQRVLPAVQSPDQVDDDLANAEWLKPGYANPPWTECPWK